MGCQLRLPNALGSMLGVAGWLWVASTSPGHAVTPDSTEGTPGGATPLVNPYLVITNRNAFGIKPPAPPPDPKANTPPAPPPNLFVTGFTRIKGVKKAYLVMNRPGKNPDFLVVDEAYDVDGLKVTSIDPKKETLTVINSGTEVTLNFKDNGVKPGSIPQLGMNNANGVVQPVAGLPGGGNNLGRPVTQVFPPGSPGAPSVIRRSGVEGLPTSDPQESDVPQTRTSRRGVYLGNGGTPPTFNSTPLNEPVNPGLPPPSASSVPAAPGIIANPGTSPSGIPRQPPPVPYLGK